jgi:hypothetical protein
MESAQRAACQDEGPSASPRAASPSLTGTGFAAGVTSIASPPDGRPSAHWSVGDDGQWLRLPQGIAVDAQGRIHVADRDLPGLVTITPGAGS